MHLGKDFNSRFQYDREQEVADFFALDYIPNMFIKMYQFNIIMRNLIVNLQEKQQYYKMEVLGMTDYLSNYIIRPSRSLYDIADLGQASFEFKDTWYQRIDFTVPSSQNNLNLQCSLYTEKFNKSNLRTTVVYLHANSSNQASVKNYLKYLLPYFDVVSFDFRGCGKSNGNHLTLGYLEKWDVKAVIQYVDLHFGQRKYMLWGRSMGAVTAILYTAKFHHHNDKVLGLVLDSPFSDLQKVIEYIGNKKLPMVPQFMLNNTVKNLQNHIKKVIKEQYNKQFLIKNHKPINQIYKIKVPIFFIGSKNDKLVDNNQIKELYENAVCRKQMEFLDGGHNQPRPEHLKLAIVEFLLAVNNMKKEPNNRRKIFSFGLNKHTLSVNQHFDGKIINEGKLFKHNSINILQHHQMSFGNLVEPPMHKQMSQIKAQQKEKQLVKSTFNEILDKLLPKNSTRRTHRIFNGIPSNNGSHNVKQNENNIQKLF